MKKTILLVLLVMVLGLVPVAGQAYTNETAFLNALLPGFFTNDFSSLSGGDQGVTSLDFSNGTFSYTLGTPGVGPTDTLFALPLGALTANALSTNNASSPIHGLNFASTGASLTGIGAFFYLTDIDGNFVPGAVSVTIDGVATEVASVSVPAFFGVIDPTGISTMEVATLDGINWVTISSLTVGSAVPLPPGALLLGVGLLRLAGYRKKFVK